VIEYSSRTRVLKKNLHLKKSNAPKVEPQGRCGSSRHL